MPGLLRLTDRKPIVSGPSTLPIPAGTISWFSGSTAPTGWSLFGVTITNAQTLYPELWSRVPDGWKSGSSLVLPNIGGKTVFSYTAQDTNFNSIGKTGGSINVNLGIANIPQHSHTVTISTAGEHTHQYNSALTRSVGSGPGTYAESSDDYFIATSAAGAHTHGASCSSVGSGAAFSVLNPYITLNAIIKLTEN